MINIRKLEADLWESADLLRAESKLTSNQYCMPVLGLIFLRYAYSRFKMVEREIMANRPSRNGQVMPVSAIDFKGKSALYLPKEAQFDYLVDLPANVVDLGLKSMKGDAMNSLGEVVSYHYNLGGLLESVSGKKEYEYSYIKQIGYDEYEQKTFVRYGNGTETNYTYSDKRRRLKNLDVTSPAYQGDKTIMANAYTYDAMDNIISLVNSTNAKTEGGKKIAGSISHNYSYDAWNRLVHADGSYESGKDDGSASYELDVEYDELYNVTSKKLSLTQSNLQFPGTLRAGHTLTYKYDKENNDPFRLLSVSATEYRTDQLDEKSDVPSDLMVNTRCDYSFDANGNLIQTASHKNRTVVDEAQSEEESPLSEEAEKGLTARMNKWDMDNHLLAINDNGYVSNYFYDAAGERTVKMSAGMEGLFVNGASKLDEKDVELKFVAYVSPYLVVKNGGEYTKHIYAGDQRIASKIGDFESFGADPRRVARAGADVPGVDVKYGEKYKDLFDRLTKDYEDFEVPCNVKKNEDFKDNQSFCCGSTDKLEELTQSGEGTAEETRPETQIFFYHPDHLGSTTLVTDIDGKIIQHVAYIPYGEVFIEERDGNWNTPYLFNAKELDEETGLYYYGARYLDPKDTRWLSVDPMFEKYVGMSPYNYCAGNPVKLVDPDGRKITEKGSQDEANEVKSLATEIKTQLNNQRNKASEGVELTDEQKKQNAEIDSRISQLDQTIKDIDDMFGDVEVDYKFRNGTPEIKATGSKELTIYWDKKDVRVHEVRHAGQVARREYSIVPEKDGGFTFSGYSIEHEVDAYKAQMGALGKFGYYSAQMYDIFRLVPGFDKKAIERYWHSVQDVTVEKVKDILDQSTLKPLYR